MFHKSIKINPKSIGPPCEATFSQQNSQKLSIGISVFMCVFKSPYFKATQHIHIIDKCHQKFDSLNVKMSKVVPPLMRTLFKLFSSHFSLSSLFITKTKNIIIFEFLLDDDAWVIFK